MGPVLCGHYRGITSFSISLIKRQVKKSYIIETTTPPVKRDRVPRHHVRHECPSSRVHAAGEGRVARALDGVLGADLPDDTGR